MPRREPDWQKSNKYRHMRIQIPTPPEIEELVSFLPKLYAKGFTPIKKWNGGTKDQDGSFVVPWPEYNEVVEAFFQVAAKEHWSDYDYSPEEAGQMIKSNEIIKTADFAQIKTMLTYCVRGERFCDGHWGAMIEEGQIRSLLQRLAEIGSNKAYTRRTK